MLESFFNYIRKILLTDLNKFFIKDRHIEGYILCNGRRIPKKIYRELYKVIKNTYGTDKPLTFQLPDFGEAPLGGEYYIKHRKIGINDNEPPIGTVNTFYKRRA